MVDGCGEELGAMAFMAGEAGTTLGGGARPAVVALPCFGAEGGRRGQVGRVG
jgi:hypothetical protein